MSSNDLIDVALGADSSNLIQRLMMWSQLTDILAQQGQFISQDRVDAALHRMFQLRDQIPVEHREYSARAISERCHFVPIVKFYSEDDRAVSRTILSRVTLTDEEWLLLIPQLSPLARWVLRERDDLPNKIKAVLYALGASPEQQYSFVNAETSNGNDIATSDRLPDASDDVTRGAIEICRIPVPQSSRSSTAPSSVTIPFLFETDTQGNINWTDAEFRGSVIGLTLAEPAFDGDSGTDAYSAGAFRQRASITSARLTIEATTPMGGEWRFSAHPLFNPSTGQFLGYKGSARRPRPGESANRLPHDKVLGSATFGDAMRQLVHELRTPLNAISGFAQIIDGQMFGPVPERYRHMADEIIADSDRLISIFGDLELAARIDSNNLRDEIGQVGFEEIVTRISRELDRVSDERGIRLRLTIPDHLPLINASADQAHRLVGRFLSAIVEVATRNELVEGQLHNLAETNQLQLDVTRPKSIAGAPESLLLDPGFTPEGDAPDAAMLSLGFSLRLVANFARELGGNLIIAQRTISLLLPAAFAQSDVETTIGA